MKIGINGTFRMHGGGGLIHLRHLLRAWSESGVDRKHALVLYIRRENVSDLQLPPGARVEIRSVGFRSEASLDRLLWEQIWFPQLLRTSDLDVLFCPGGIAPMRSPVPVVVAFPNAAPFSREVTAKTAGRRNHLRFQVLGKFMLWSARVATRVIFISRYFCDLFHKCSDFPLDRSDVIYHGRDAFVASMRDDMAAGRLGITRPYVLSASHLYRYKNMPALIRGYGLARDILQRRNLGLLLVGRPKESAYGEKLRRLIRQEDLDEWVLMPGPVPHEQIGPLLSGCEFFVFQSLCENCPNTLIEALAGGVPIACARVGVMPEIAGDAALYFNPFSATDIARALVRLAEDSALRAELRQKALVQSAKFPTWKEVGDLTIASLERAATAGSKAGPQMQGESPCVESPVMSELKSTGKS